VAGQGRGILQQPMMDYKFYSEDQSLEKNFNLISGVVPEDRVINDIREAYDFEGALVYVDSNIFSSSHVKKEIFDQRLNKSLITKMLIDRSFETGLSENDFNNKIQQLAKLGIDTKDMIFVFNRSAYHEWMDKHIEQIILIDLFAISAAIRHVIYRQPVCEVDVKDRPNKINFLVGKVNKPSRLLLLKKFFESSIKNDTVFSILGLPKDTTDKNFLKFLIDNQGPIDGAATMELEQGTSSQGWGNNSTPYNNTSVSFICETHETNDSLFITEKTYRPIINKHPFVARASFPLLKYLRAIGFKTFNDFVDENYDDESRIDNEYTELLVTRAQELLEITKNHPEKIQDVVDHNYKMLIKFAQSELALFNKRIFDSLK